jgi:hypothetical protein
MAAVIAEPAEPAAPAAPAGPAPAGRMTTRHGPRSSVNLQRWTRLAHTYTSMAALLVVLFFGATGLTLNHPDWTFGFDETVSHAEGSLPEPLRSDGDAVELLAVSEFLRAEHGVRGTVNEFGADDTGGWLSYRGPGYAAEATYDSTAGTFTLDVTQQGVVGVLNDLHKGRDTDSPWRGVIDVAAVFLVLIAASGLVLQLLLRRRRRLALTLAAIGGLLCSAVAWSTVA